MKRPMSAPDAVIAPDGARLLNSNGPGLPDPSI